MKIKTLGWLIIPAIAFPSCTEKALDYRSDEGTVTIAPSGAILPVRLLPATVLYDGCKAVAGDGADVAASAGQFSITLPVGGYRLLAYNTDARGVAFTGLENRHSAEIRLTSDVQPGNVYSWNVDDVNVPLRGTVQYTPVPRRLVKQMVLHFQVTGMEEAKVLNGKMNGVYPALFLLSGEPSAESVAAAPDTRTEFTVTLTRAKAQAGNTDPAYRASADIRLLGLLCPDGGTSYDCVCSCRCAIPSARHIALRWI